MSAKAVTPKKPKPTPRAPKKPEAPGIPEGAVAIDFQDVANSLTRQVAEQAGRIAMLEAQNAGLRRKLDERKVAPRDPAAS